MEFVQAVETLAAKLGMEVPHEAQNDKPKPARNLYTTLEAVAEHYQQELKKNQTAIDYLIKRGFSGEMAREYQLGYAQEGWHSLEKRFPHSKADLISTGMLIENDEGKVYDRYRQRIMFPIHDRQGRIIGFGGRAIEAEQTPKYLNSPETSLFQKSRELYGLYQVLAQKASPQTLFVVEGYLDVIALSQFGIRNSVATLGTATTSYHLQVLAKYCQNIIFCFDGDNAGRKAAWRALETSLPYLNSGLNVCFMFLAEGHDPDSLVRKKGKDAFMAEAQDAQAADEFLLAHLSQGLDLRSMAHKNQLIKAITPYLESIGTGPYQALLIEKLSRITHLEPQRIFQHTVGNAKEISLLQGQTLTRTPLRVALALLIQHPELYFTQASTLAPELFLDSTHPLIGELMQAILHDANQNTARILEQWRDTPHFNALSKLAAWEHHVPEAALAQEFTDTLQFLLNQDHENKIGELLAKSRLEGLTEEEKHVLSRLIRERHQR